MNVGDKIKNARIAKGMTQEELGKLLGLQKSAIAKYESGRVVNIKRSTLKKISDILGIRPSELIFEEDITDELQKKNDVATDIVIRLGADDDFCELVKLLYKLDSSQIKNIKTMLSGFIK